MPKESVFTMKLEPELRDEFMAEAEAAHRPASQIVRDLMRDFIRRQREALRLSKGGTVHSQHDGNSFDARRFCRSERTAKLIVEPILVAIFGTVLWWIYLRMGWHRHGLPAFILTGIFTLPFVEKVKQTVWERRLQGMQDAKLEQQALVRESHQRFGDS